MFAKRKCNKMIDKHVKKLVIDAKRVFRVFTNIIFDTQTYHDKNEN